MQDSTDSSELKMKQALAIHELLNPENKSNIEIAEKVKVSERTLYNWFRDPNFARELEKERRYWSKRALDTFLFRFAKASKVLDELMESKNEVIKLKACQAVVNFHFKVLEFLDHEDQIKALDERLTKGGL